MATTDRLLEVGPLSVDVPATAGIQLWGASRFAAWSSKDLLRITIGKYSLSLTDEGMLELREYENSPTNIE